MGSVDWFKSRRKLLWAAAPSAQVSQRKLSARIKQHFAAALLVAVLHEKADRATLKTSNSTKEVKENLNKRRSRDIWGVIWEDSRQKSVPHRTRNIVPHNQCWGVFEDEKSAAIHQSFAWKYVSVDGASKGQKSWLQNSISEPSYHSSSAMTWHTKWGQNAATAGLLVLRMLWLEGDWILFSQSWIKCKWVSSKLKFNWLSELRKQQPTSDRSLTHPHTYTQMHKTHKT